jgi:hypothetical protein
MGFSIPTERYIALQFLPKHKGMHSAVNYTGQFQVVYRVQLKSFHIDHPHSQYVNKLMQYQRAFVLLPNITPHVTLVSLDDKHCIPVGEPGAPVDTSTGSRRAVPQLASSRVVACDHDFTIAKLTPSVMLVTTLPDSLNGSWYQGHVTVLLKDAVIQASNPFRHAAELADLLRARAGSGSIPPVLCLQHDGGPDHNVTFASVILANLCLAVSLDLDILCAMRTCPKNSFRNPVERCMSGLNYALQSTATARGRMPSEMEELLGGANSMEGVRKAIDAHPDLLDAWRDSMAPVTAVWAAALHESPGPAIWFLYASPPARPQLRSCAVRWATM